MALGASKERLRPLPWRRRQRLHLPGPLPADVGPQTPLQGLHGEHTMSTSTSSALTLTWTLSLVQSSCSSQTHSGRSQPSD